jgi:hypothetical protein
VISGLWSLSSEENCSVTSFLKRVKISQIKEEAIHCHINSKCHLFLVISPHLTFLPSPMAEIKTKWSQGPVKKEISKGGKETGSDASIQVGRQAERPRRPYPLLEPGISLLR